MKRIVILIGALVILASCDKASELTQFEIETTTEITIPAAAGTNLPIDIITPDIQSNSSTTFENNNTRADLIEEISLRECDLTITSPSDANFDFLKSIEVYMSTDSEPEVLIAEKQDIQNGQGQHLDLETTGADLSEYIKASSYDLRIEIVTDEIPGSEIDIDIRSVFFVDAKILGL